jgi:ribosome-binding ATPase YchF (GTP1/OBG family)
MKLSLGIVGLPNVGKSTLFKALTKNDIVIANYPFATIDPNIGVVAVPDERVEKLATLSKSKKKIPAIVEFYDIAGLVKGASKGEGLGNQFLMHIKEVQAIVQVVRAFPASEIIHVEETTDPMRDMEIINTELILKDLESVDKRLKTIEGEAKTGKKEAVRELELMGELKRKLERGELLKNFANDPAVKNLNLLTAKAMFYLINGKEEDVPEVLKQGIAALGSSYVVADLSDADFDLAPVIREAYKILGLISFFTTGEDETRAWTIVRGEKAPEAAGAIHSDFEKKFIRADVIQWDKLIEAGSWSGAKQKGLMRTEGKEYVVLDGDVMEIKHS